MTKLLEIDQLSIEFANASGPIRVVSGISLALESGQTLGIVGESGSGKSVTSLSVMRLLPSGLARVVEGDIRLRGQSLLDMSESQMQKVRGNQIATIFQEPMTALNPVFKIGRQIRESIRQHSKKGKKEAHQQSIELLSEVGISSPEQIMEVYPHQLSGGMRQRVMIAMAMASNPEILIADEPTTALDVTIQAQILDLMRKLQKVRGTAIILITHDLGVVAETCDRVCVMYAGQIVEQGDVQSLFKNPKHPYTVGLLNSMPQFSGEMERLQAIAGQVPHPSEFAAGCRFASRCPSKMDVCEHIDPAFYDMNDGHSCKCHLYREVTNVAYS
ncbi:oligopeptide/dipeptide ABC transporter ATP-binding protein [Paenibacillus cellulosilyticus]|uniref:Oligopeptide/dipeptide ABC transporter ATP-binding protein n=1 Tax=Paenibacillus cellulosilyticus TaxID=375489 RepID=A0A2V2Z1N6_9BACL|nr:ABC transporter ATP-binding protein [Paenibacillus cellulosilyticus]PWW08767.1 oligopeptide/dipeptide ABC transporter ATP-binding protein [Paenibacillus cellulosilyticus]QKS48323.1 ABC transporter ATP-binding protein [Paenibacillus cellulosilyticus]